MKRSIFFSCLLSFFSLSMACAQQPSTTKVAVYNFDDKEALKQYESLQLDDSHPNLLDPRFSQESHQEVVENWTQLHRELAGFWPKKNSTGERRSPT